MRIAESFLQFVKVHCKAVGVKLVLDPSSEIIYHGGTISGSFEAHPSPKLKVAIGCPEDKWLPVLAHEYAHMLQWSEGSKVWRDLTLKDGREASDTFHSWAAKEIELSEDELKSIVSIVVNVELDAERRVLGLIDKFGLPIDKIHYARLSNAYVMFHHLVHEFRSWWGETSSPYKIPEVLDLLPGNLDGDYSSISPKHREILMRCLPKAVVLPLIQKAS